MCPLLAEGRPAAGFHRSLDGEDSATVSLESIQAPAAFVDRSARILHANSAFYNLVRCAELGEADWLAAFEQEENIRAHLGAVEDSYDLTPSRFNHADQSLMLWIAASANAQPTTGRREAIRLISLHCASDAVRLGLVLREESDQEGGAQALQRHYAALANPDALHPSDGRPPNPTRRVLEALAMRASHRSSSAIGGYSIASCHTPFV